MMRTVAAGAVLVAAQLGGTAAASAAPATAEGGCAYPAPVVTTTQVSLDLAVVKAGGANTARATVTSDKGPVDGTVTFTVAGYAAETVPLVDGTASYSLPTDLVAGRTYEVTAAANVTGDCLQPSSGSAYVTVADDDEALGISANRAAPSVTAPSSGLLPSVGAEAGTGLLALGGAAVLAAGLLTLVWARRRAGA